MTEKFKTDGEIKKKSSFRPLAIISFIGAVILIAWFAVRLVNVAPSAFSSLASLAESLNSGQTKSEVDNEPSVNTPELPTFIVSSNTTLLEAGGITEISWEKINKNGSYTFSYECAEGVAIDILNINGLQSITCDSKYNVGDVNSLSLTIDSEKNRYADIRYFIDFLGTNDTKPQAGGRSSLTVVNSKINSVSENETEEVASAPVTETVSKTPNPDTSTNTTPPKTVNPLQYEQEFVYTLPTSDPNGQPDLATRFLNTGTIIENTFFSGVIKQNEKGAVQFEVKNVGSKTSDKWQFKVSLPNGDIYTSNTQLPLKPNERAVLTVGFSTDRDAQHIFKVAVDSASDKNSKNDGFKQTVTFVK